MAVVCSALVAVDGLIVGEICFEQTRKRKRDEWFIATAGEVLVGRWQALEVSDADGGAPIGMVSPLLL